MSTEWLCGQWQMPFYVSLAEKRKLTPIKYSRTVVNRIKSVLQRCRFVFFVFFFFLVVASAMRPVFICLSFSAMSLHSKHTHSHAREKMCATNVTTHQYPNKNNILNYWLDWVSKFKMNRSSFKGSADSLICHVNSMGAERTAFVVLPTCLYSYSPFGLIKFLKNDIDSLISLERAIRSADCVPVEIVFVGMQWKYVLLILIATTTNIWLTKKKSNEFIGRSEVSLKMSKWDFYRWVRKVIRNERARARQGNSCVDKHGN